MSIAWFLAIEKDPLSLLLAAFTMNSIRVKAFCIFKAQFDSAPANQLNLRSLSVAMGFFAFGGLIFYRAIRLAGWAT